MNLARTILDNSSDIHSFTDCLGIGMYVACLETLKAVVSCLLLIISEDGQPVCFVDFAGNTICQFPGGASAVAQASPVSSLRE